MAKSRDWAKDVAGTDIKFLRKDGDYIFCVMQDFEFKVHRSSWPPKRLSPEVCLTPTEFYKHQVRQLHGNRYDLSNTVYKSADSLVKAGCEKHGEFEIQAKYLKSVRGCPLCGYEHGARLSSSNTEDFIAKARTVHGDFYDYSVTNYKSASTDVEIVCPKHGSFKQIPYNHLVGKGCMECGWERSKMARVLNPQEVLDRFHSVHMDRYDYHQMNYTGDAHGLLDIICREHGLFKQSYANHYHNGQGCPECAKEFSPRLKKGFVKSAVSKNGYASLYLINCFDEDESFYKIGITTKPIQQRFSGKEAMPYHYTLEYLFVGEAEFIWDLEKLLHKEYKLHKYLPEKEFGGRYECFSQIDVDEYKKLLYTAA